MQVITFLSKFLALPILLIIRGYQVIISPFLGQNCRFHPTCSCYAHEALSQHGALKGSYLSVKRIVKCQPLHPGGIDLVPQSTPEKKTQTPHNNASLKDVNTKL